MSLDTDRTRKLLQSFGFKTLFVEELGWDNYTAPLVVPVDERDYTLNAIVEKRGMVVFVYEVEQNVSMPDYSVRRKIERQVAKSAREHIIIYVNSEKALQIWQWVKREAGKPTACREHRFYSAQPGDSLIQKINNLIFTLEDEEKGLTVLDASGRAKKAFDVEKITKRFYDRFKAEHERFSEFLKGIPDEKLQRWYVSVMLNRLMFIYFIQKKGFLDNDTNYLRSRLRKSKQYGKDLYYQKFLCPLFFEGFAKKEAERSPETNRLLGTVPYLNGGLFQHHQIEKWYGKEIQIEDATFENLFAFFDEYDWHLDERP
ncbi:MAG: SAM-dependent methyltransferase, partial [Deltaproteobacteria bacterium]|nr:SAM-dependent methyltransferase [Deltaproteobacteria bacterium]